MRLFTIAVALFGLASMSGQALAATGGTPAKPPSEAQLNRECNGGRAASCGELGQDIRDKADGSQRKLKRAVALFQRACDRGDIIGCGDLAQSYLFGEGVAIDEAKAARLSMDACTAGGDIGCALMGIIHEQGKAGRAKNDVLARAFFNQACRSSQPRWEFPCERAEALATRAAPSAPSQPAAASQTQSARIDANIVPTEFYGKWVEEKYFCDSAPKHAYIEFSARGSDIKTGLDPYAFNIRNKILVHHGKFDALGSFERVYDYYGLVSRDMARFSISKDLSELAIFKLFVELEEARRISRQLPTIQGTSPAIYKKCY